MIYIWYIHMIYTYIYIRIWYIFLYIFIHILCVTSSDIPSHLILMVIFRFHFVNFQGSNLWGDSIGVGRGARSHGVEIFIQKLVADRCWNAGRTSILPCFFCSGDGEGLSLESAFFRKKMYWGTDLRFRSLMFFPGWKKLYDLMTNDDSSQELH